MAAWPDMPDMAFELCEGDETRMDGEEIDDDDW